MKAFSGLRLYDGSKNMNTLSAMRIRDHGDIITDRLDMVVNRSSANCNTCLLECFRSPLFTKYRPRPDCFYMSSLIWVHTFCLST